ISPRLSSTGCSSEERTTSCAADRIEPDISRRSHRRSRKTPPDHARRRQSLERNGDIFQRTHTMGWAKGSGMAERYMIARIVGAWEKMDRAVAFFGLDRVDFQILGGDR